MNDYLERSQQLLPKSVAHRRALHQNPEVGDSCPATAAYISDYIFSLGFSSVRYDNDSVVAELGTDGPCVIYRADIDALPVREQSGLPFAADNGCCHCCGHDFHTAAALTAFEILSTEKLCGRVRFVFQSDEERIHGAQYLIERGVADGANAAISMHVASGLRAGSFNVMPGGYLASSDIFSISIGGRSSHGSMPERSIDPILVASKIVLEAQTITSRLIDALEPVVVTFGSFNAGTTPNIIPDSAVLTGTVRAFSDDSRTSALEWLKKMSETVCGLYGAGCEFSILSATPVTYNDPVLTDAVVRAAVELLGEAAVGTRSLKLKASDDFAFYGSKIPSVMYHIGVGDASQGCMYPLHNPRIVMDEQSLVSMAACAAYLTNSVLQSLKSDRA